MLEQDNLDQTDDAAARKAQLKKERDIRYRQNEAYQKKLERERIGAIGDPMRNEVEQMVAVGLSTEAIKQKVAGRITSEQVDRIIFRMNNLAGKP